MSPSSWSDAPGLYGRGSVFEAEQDERAVVPFTGGDLTAVMASIVRYLEFLAGVDERGTLGIGGLVRLLRRGHTAPELPLPALPPPLAARRGLHALRGVRALVEIAEELPPIQPTAPDGYPLVPLVFLRLGSARRDVVNVCDLIAPQPRGERHPTVDCTLKAIDDDPGRLIEDAGRLSSLLELPWTLDAEILRFRLDPMCVHHAANPPTSVRLSELEQAACDRLVAGFLSAWHRDPLAELLYRH